MSGDVVRLLYSHASRMLKMSSELEKFVVSSKNPDNVSASMDFYNKIGREIGLKREKGEKVYKLRTPKKESNWEE